MVGANCGACGVCNCLNGIKVRPMTEAQKIRKALMKAVENKDRLAISKVLRRFESEKRRIRNGRS